MHIDPPCLKTYHNDGLPEGDDFRFHLLKKQHDLLIALDEAALWS